MHLFECGFLLCRRKFFSMSQAFRHTERAHKGIPIVPVPTAQIILRSAREDVQFIEKQLTAAIMNYTSEKVYEAMATGLKDQMVSKLRAPPPSPHSIIPSLPDFSQRNEYSEIREPVRFPRPSRATQMMPDSWRNSKNQPEGQEKETENGCAEDEQQFSPGEDEQTSVSRQILPAGHVPEAAAEATISQLVIREATIEVCKVKPMVLKIKKDEEPEEQPPSASPTPSIIWEGDDPLEDGEISNEEKTAGCPLKKIKKKGKSFSNINVSSYFGIYRL